MGDYLPHLTGGSEGQVREEGKGKGMDDALGLMGCCNGCCKDNGGDGLT